MHAQIKHGETFKSETDTEVIPKLCRFVYHRLTEKVPFPKVRAAWHLALVDRAEGRARARPHGMCEQLAMKRAQLHAWPWPGRPCGQCAGCVRCGAQHTVTCTMLNAATANTQLLDGCTNGPWQAAGRGQHGRVHKAEGPCRCSPSLPLLPPSMQLVMEVLKKLEGAYALLIKSSHYPGAHGVPSVWQWSCGLPPPTHHHPNGNFLLSPDVRRSNMHPPCTRAPIHCLCLIESAPGSAA